MSPSRLPLIAAALLVAMPVQAGDKPNIVVMLADDLGYGDVHCLNPQRGKIATPNLDRLAAQGMTFTDCHGGSSVCTPTRYGLLTGRYAWRTRLQAGVLDSDTPPLIAAERLTVAQLLREHGYHTACLGKWHLGYEFEKSAGGNEDKKRNSAAVGTRIIGGPTTRGFEGFFGFSHARAIGLLVEDERIVERIDAVEMLPRLTRRAVEMIAQRAASGRPFFLYLAFNSPHTPIVPSDEWKGKSGLGDYADYVMQTDGAVGQVLDAIDRAGVSKNTLVIASSDNGCSPAAGIRELKNKGHFPSAQFRGYKADIWDGGHRIPFLVRWPGRVKPASQSNSLLCLTDLIATVAAVLGAKLPDNAGEDSVSFLPDLLGQARPPRRAVVHHSISGHFAIRDAAWKLELCAGSGGWATPKEADAHQQGLPPVQLYDMASDPGETKNLQAERPEVVKRLTALLDKTVADGRSTPGSPQKNDVPIDLWKQNKDRKRKER